ncbi:hypothetical protein EIN_097100 [Entamoeba invadens IP1]|uniref:Uncharacterized protein n=1 Tax=Entamoeba invadens IP1 TaxID=370355 RepID=A0A0A1U418_ENTIV|nr:hypothetical protein EIN_097100 [Entamoeba invadens IP1]ELP87443.1 hypothetical protein EIN_097100 [Entamoeba invadens IP1]|eukprot:XP_004254214.1 hypothetical protein EIN_097100 [Entamoeba invadens IP1]
MTTKETKSIKIILLGESGVGKTALTQRYMENTFDQLYLSTIGVDFSYKEITRNGINLRVCVWDTAGQERFRSIGKSYYKGADGAVVVFDVNNPDSFRRAQYWIDELQTEDAGQCTLLVGNKIDLEKRVNDEQVYQMYPGKLYIKTSAKTSFNIDLVFSKFLDLYFQNTTHECSTPPSVVSPTLDVHPPLLLHKGQHLCTC